MSLDHIIFRALHGIRHRLAAGDEYILHSPFLFNWYNHLKTLKSELGGNDLLVPFENVYKQFSQPIEVIDFGAGGAITHKTIDYIKRVETLAPKWRSLIGAIILRHQPKTIVELGTSIGISTAYWASILPESRIISFEGSPALCEISRNLFHHIGLNNIKIIEGNIDDTLHQSLNHLDDKIDVVFMDANHKYEPTIRYFNELLPYLHEESIVILDDINHSKEMYKAWKEIISWDTITVSVEFGRIGVIMFREGIRKQDFKLKW